MLPLHYYYTTTMLLLRYHYTTTIQPIMSTTTTHLPTTTMLPLHYVTTRQHYYTTLHHHHHYTTAQIILIISCIIFFCSDDTWTSIIDLYILCSVAIYIYSLFQTIFILLCTSFVWKILLYFTLFQTIHFHPLFITLSLPPPPGYCLPNLTSSWLLPP